ncbi:cupin domain-containing protein [Gordonia sp. PP30]|uniref:cupin domain-containing protein n=1 Tax=unclassified Gordonia (in: high G+C Gram-positive bacteria) TaxID=2657482 RepID=UPI001FFF342A|nr:MULTISPECIES: cupin domain-containing protein [unclassified Gordonia (in: high G+C Gram-positive bacteria)]UQE74170.1 cupin domain-containing protein [Gordonia sp. PP30]
MSTAPTLNHIGDLTAYKISPEDTVTLTVLSGPATSGSGSTVCFEIWDPRGSQPDNSHPESTETFVVLKGSGIAHSDEHIAALNPGTVLVLPKGSVHHIVNTSDTEKMYTVTVMESDGGFEDMILRGVPVELTDDDRAVLATAAETGIGRQ